MNNKTAIEEDIKMLKELNVGDDIEFKQAIENILEDRERLIKKVKIQEDNYQILSESVFNVAKELDLEEEATIDEIITKIRILKSKRINMFEELDCIDKANKYDSLIEKIIKKLEYIEPKYIENVAKVKQEKLFNIRMQVFRGIQLEGQRKLLKELLNTEKEN